MSFGLEALRFHAVGTAMHDQSNRTSRERYLRHRGIVAAKHGVGDLIGGIGES